MTTYYGIHVFSSFSEMVLCVHYYIGPLHKLRILCNPIKVLNSSLLIPMHGMICTHMYSRTFFLQLLVCCTDEIPYKLPYLFFLIPLLPYYPGYKAGPGIRYKAHTFFLLNRKKLKIRNIIFRCKAHLAGKRQHFQNSKETKKRRLQGPGLITEAIWWKKLRKVKFIQKKKTRK